jgi:hypothetical protein
MPSSQDIPTQLFLDQIENTAVRSVLAGTGSLPDSMSPSSFLLSLTDGLNRAQIIFNSENGTLPNIATVSGRELGPISVAENGKLQAQVFYTVGGNLFFDAGEAGPILV